MDHSDPAPTAERLLQHLKRHGPRPTAVLAEALGLTAEAARQQIRKLAEAGLLAAQPAPPRGAVRSQGRPGTDWALTAAGHARFPDGHAVLGLQMIAAIRQSFGEAGLEAAIAAREAAMAATYRAACPGPGLEARLRQLAAQRSAEGYMARVEQEAGAWRLVEDHCPICAAASACQGFCRSELALFRALLGPEAEVTREQHLLSGAARCAYRVRPVTPPAAAPA
ncbi:transcriptional regulator [Pseudoroseomonas deserti]|uniref:Transcriptional regulator n=1 Tax=Teichococcus deserti TaxID=1817963 RepID=A0A1V2GZ85_9PROT|nr:helix-turn-helix domain-containing protein [Pseudoroseomonas deserti]ONG50672.1 transcriptional regulator [Pseudoroseomonas deserti]